MARNLGRFFCTDQPGRRPQRRIGDANGGGEGENDPGFGGDPNGGDPDELCRMNRGESGLYEGRDQGGRSWRLRVNKDKSVSLLKPSGAGDEDPDQILLEQPPGSAGELPKAALGRDANAGAVGEIYPPRGSGRSRDRAPALRRGAAADRRRRPRRGPGESARPPDDRALRAALIPCCRSSPAGRATAPRPASAPWRGISWRPLAGEKPASEPP